MDDLNYESNTLSNNNNNVLTNQNINQNNQREVMNLLKDNSDFIDKLYSNLEDQKYVKYIFQNKSNKDKFYSKK